MRRLPVITFAALVLASIAAFFVTQHLKISTPLIAGAPAPNPAVINPFGPVCPVPRKSAPPLPNHRRMYISFYLLHRSDVVSVYIVNAAGEIVRTLASGRSMRKGVRVPDGIFTWNGRDDDGRFAPDGTYYVRVALLHQGRTIDLPMSGTGKLVSVRVRTRAPRPVITGLTPSYIPYNGSTQVTIHFHGNEHRSGVITIYRTDLPGPPRPVARFTTRWGAVSASWDGRISGHAAPQGTYLISLAVSDATCHTGRYPAEIPPAPGSSRHAGVTVRYLAAEPPLTATPAGSRATVAVDARQRPFRWALWRVGGRKPSARGAQRAVTLRLKLPPAQDAGLYHLVIRAGGDRTDVPLLADHPGHQNAPHVLVVVPALSWQGVNPVDDTGGGLPNTLSAGLPVLLSRPLVNGLPPGWGDLSALLGYLDASSLPYDLTSDLGLIEGVGPSLTGHTAIVLAGVEQWVPSSLGTALRRYVLAGGKVLVVGSGSLLRGVTIRGGVALSPTAPAAQDVFGAQPGTPVSANRDLITVISDHLGIFSNTSGALPGYPAFGTIHAVAPPAQVVAAAGTSNAAQAIVAFRLGRGVVIEVGLAGFGSSLAGNVDAQDFLLRLWSVLRH